MGAEGGAGTGGGLPDWDQEADRLAERSLATGDATGWFDRLYRAGAAGEVSMPWDREGPNGALAQWAQGRRLVARGEPAIVVGCGLGADAEFAASLGYETTAFDVSETAVQLARDRVPDSPVDYTVADLFALPEEWRHSFALVVEVFTVQALPPGLRAQATAAVASLVAPGGTLVVVYSIADGSEAAGAGPPWLLTRAEVEAFARDGLETVTVEDVDDSGAPGRRRWLGEFRSPAQPAREVTAPQ